MNSEFSLRARAAQKPPHMQNALRHSAAKEAAVQDMLRLCSQRCADAWARRVEWRANHAKSPTSRSHPKTQGLEKGADYRAETSFAAKSSVGDSCTARNCRQPTTWVFNVAIDSKLRGCDLIKLTVTDLGGTSGHPYGVVQLSRRRRRLLRCVEADQAYRLRRPRLRALKEPPDVSVGARGATIIGSLRWVKHHLRSGKPSRERSSRR